MKEVFDISLSALIVDDEVSTRDILVNFLPWKELGIHTVLDADDGKSALQIAEKSKPNIIISDIKMPHMNGIDLAREIRQILPKCKFIFLSAYPNKEYLLDAIKLKVSSFVEKPIDLEEITELLKEQVRECKNELTLDPRVLFFKGETSTNHRLNDKVYQFNKKDLKRLSDSILSKNKEEAIAILHHLFCGLRHCEGTALKEIRHIFCKIILQFIKAAENCNLQEILVQKDYLLYTAPASQTLKELEDIVIDVCKTYFNSTAIDNSDMVTRLNLYLSTYFTQTNLTVRDIANDLGFSYTYLCNAYKKACGKTVNQQLTYFRIEYAKELLKVDNLKLYEVANTCGYADPKYFSKVFLKETGLTPKQYRERHCYEI